MERKVKGLSGGLIKFKKITPEPEESWEISKRIGSVKTRAQFIHQSAENYMITSGLMLLSNQIPNSIVGQAHLQLSMACIQFIILTGMRNVHTSSFLEYALQNWITHAQIADTKHIAQTNLLTLFEWPSHRVSNILVSQYQKYLMTFRDGYDYPTSETTLLHIAARYNLPNLLKRILESSNDLGVNTRDESGRTPLLYAAESKNVSTVQVLLKHHHIDVNCRGEEGFTPLFYAVHDDTLTTLQLLLERDDIDINVVTPGCGTPLMLTCTTRRWKVAELLLKRNDVTTCSRTKDGKMLLSLAAGYGERRIVKMLLKRVDIDVNGKDTLGLTPLMYAIQGGHEEIVHLLLGHQDINIEEVDRDGWTALSRTIVRRPYTEGYEEEPAQKRLDSDTKHDYGDNADKTLPSHPVRTRQLRIVQILLQHGANVNRTDLQGKTPLFVAVSHDERDIAKLLLQQGVKVDARNKQEGTPLFFAALNGRKEIAELLLRWGANVDARNGEEETPLFAAVKVGHFAAAETFLR